MTKKKTLRLAGGLTAVSAIVVLLALVRPTAAADATIFERFLDDQGSARTVAFASWLGQTFTVGDTGPNLDHQPTIVRLFVNRNVAPIGNNIHMHLRNVDGGGLPTSGPDLAHQVIGDGVTPAPGALADWVLTLPSTTLQAGVTYAVMLHLDAAGPNAGIQWHDARAVAPADPGYSGGQAVISLDGGATWQVQVIGGSTNLDRIFEIEGSALDVLVAGELDISAESWVGRRGPVWTDQLTGYLFFVSNVGDQGLRYKKTVDGGLTWGAEVSLVVGVATIASEPAVWYDRWTKGDAGNLIAVAYRTGGDGDVHFRTLNTLTDTLGTQRTIFNGTSGDGATNIGLVKAVGGNYYVAINSNSSGIGLSDRFFRSTNGGDTWTQRVRVQDPDVNDNFIMTPGNESDPNDIYLFQSNFVAQTISLHVYDDSANTFTTTLIASAYRWFALKSAGAAQRHSDGHSILVMYGPIPVDSTNDIRVFDVSGAASIVEKTEVLTDVAGLTADILIDQNTGDLYVPYLRGPNASSQQLFFKVSRDGGTTWEAEQAYSVFVGEARLLMSGTSVSGPGRFEPSWIDDTAVPGRDLFVNFANSIAIPGGVPPTIDFIDPVEGLDSGGTSVEINGTDFVSGATVTFGGVPAVSVIFANSFLLFATTPPNPVGAVDVTVINPDSQTGTLSDGFTYISITPDVTVTADPTVTGNYNGNIDYTGPVWIDSQTAYFFFLNDSVPSRFVYVKTVDGGATWGTQVTVSNGLPEPGEAHWVWYDRWTPGDTGNLIHLIYADDATLHGIRYRSLDTTTDVLGTQQTVFSPGGSAQAAQLVIGKARNGDLWAGWHSNDANLNFGDWRRSTNGGASWVDPGPNAFETALDNAILMPASNTGDDADMWVLFHETTADEISLKEWDASASTLTETVFGTNNYAGGGFWTAFPRHSDGHVFLLIQTTGASFSSDYQTWEINGGSSIVQRTNIRTADIPGFQSGGMIDQNTGRIYAAWASASAAGVVNYKTSDDGGVTWSAVTQFSDGTHTLRRVNSSLSIRSGDTGRWMPVWFDQSPADFESNFSNSIALGSVATLTVASVTPAVGPVAGGTSVEINGAGFAAGATVTFEGVPATGVSVASSTAITAITPANPAGAVDVTVTNPDSQFGTLLDGFTYLPPGDVTIDADALGPLDTFNNGRGYVQVTPLIHYAFYLSATTVLSYRKSTDGGGTWGAEVDLYTGLAIKKWDVWFDQWTAGNVGTEIHIIYISRTGVESDKHYISLDTADDSVTTPVNFIAGGVTPFDGWNRHSISIIVDRGGHLWIAGWIAQGTTDNFLLRSTDGGATWTIATDLTSPADGLASDKILLLPGKETNPHNIWAIYQDLAANNVRLKVYDSVADTWSDTLITALTSTSNDYFQMGAATQFSNGNVFLAIWNEFSAATADMLVYELQDATTFVQRDNGGLTNFNFSFHAQVMVDQATPDRLRVWYFNGAPEVSVSVFFIESTDSGVSFGPRTQYSATSDDHRWLAVPPSQGLAGGAFQAVWRNDDLSDVLTNFDNAVALAPVAPVAPAPTIDFIDPVEGPVSVGTPVEINGTNFVSGATVTFGGVAATSTVLSSSTIAAVTPDNPAGAVGVTVTNPDGQSDTLENGYTYVPPPKPTFIRTPEGPLISASSLSGTPVTIEGERFVSGATVTFGGVAASSTVVSSSTIDAVTPSRTSGEGAGAVDVVVTNPDGQTGTLSRGFTYGTVIDLSIAVYKLLPTQQDQEPYEEIIRHFADAVFEASNETHKVGKVTVHTGGVFSDLDDTVWVETCGPKSVVSGFVNDGQKVRFCDVFGDVNFIAGDPGATAAERRQDGGYTFGHEWGHYFYSLYDEYTGTATSTDPDPTQPRTNDTEVQESIMSRHWNARIPGLGLPWLNFSTPLNASSTVLTPQQRVYGASAWETLVRLPTQDPPTGAFKVSIPDRIFHADLADVAPTSTPPKINLFGNPPCSGTSCSELEIVWATREATLMIVLDKSGSMISNNKMENAKEAAKTLVDLAHIGETTIGLIAFNEDVQVVKGLTQIDSQAAKDQLKAAIDSIQPSGDSAIFDAAQRALDKLEEFGGGDTFRSVFLLTDGDNNAGTITDRLQVISAYVTARVRLHTFGFGPDADVQTLGDLARGTGGFFFSTPTTRELVHSFLVAFLQVSPGVGIATDSATVATSTPTVFPIVVDSTITDLDVIATYPGLVSAVTLTLRDPLGATSTPTCSSSGVESACVFSVTAAAVGTWELEAIAATSDVEVTFSALGSPDGAFAYAASLANLTGQVVEYPEPVVLSAVLIQDVPIAGAVVTASIERPDGTLESLTLTDDGVAPDDLASDGSYSAITSYSENGIHTVTVRFDNSAGTAELTEIGFASAIGEDGPLPPPDPIPIAENFQRFATIQIRVDNFQADDHGDTPPLATDIQPDNSDAPGRIDFAGDVDVFRVDVANTGELVLRVANLALGMDPRVRVIAADTITVLADIDLASNASLNGYLFFRLDVTAGDTVYAEVSDVNGSAGGFYSISGGSAFASDVLSVSIDIKPGSDPNCFNNDGNGVIPVAILGSSSFDVTTVDAETVELEGLTVRVVGKSNKLLASIEDVNSDGFNDLVVKIEDEDGVFSLGATIATLTGALLDGTPIEGTDTICIVP